MRCRLSDGRVERCGFRYGAGGQMDRTIECLIDGSSFEAHLTGLADGVDYSYRSYAVAGDAEIESDVFHFRSQSVHDPIVFEDPAFRDCLVRAGNDWDGDGEISYAEAEGVIQISISPTNRYNLKSLREIELMPNLEVIDCCGEWLEAQDNAAGTLEYVDVSRNPKLKELKLSNNSALGVEMGTIDLSWCPGLKYLDLGMTNLEYPDISSNTELEQIHFECLRGTFPDLSRFTKLKTLYCPQCGLTSLDVTGNPELETLDCRDNIITTLDVSKNARLSSLHCSPMDDENGRNVLSVLIVSQNQVIPGVTENRSSEFVPDETQIQGQKQHDSIYPPDDEIWYTSRTGTILGNLDYNICLNLNMVSNTYEDGMGVLKFNGPVTYFKEWAIYKNNNLTELIIPSSVKVTSYSCFRENQQMRRVVFAPGLLILGDSSLHHNEALEEVILPDTVKSIEKDALSHAYSLKHIDLPPYLETLGRSAFLYCGALESIVLPATMKSMGIYCFEHDKALKSVTCLAPEPPAGGTEMFDDTSECPIYVPAESVDAYRSAPYWKNYAHRIRAIED